MTAQEETKNSQIKRKVDEFLEYLEVEKGSSPLTIRNYRHYLYRLINWLEKENIRHYYYIDF